MAKLQAQVKQIYTDSSVFKLSHNIIVNLIFYIFREGNKI